MSFSYCDLAHRSGPDSVHRRYHDTEYGFPLACDNALFERLVLEINQAGLSWETILKRQAGFREAYHGFDVERIAAYGDAEVARLLGDARIIRNRLKIAAAIHNARVVHELQAAHGSFGAWLDAHHPLPLDEWVRLFKRTFHFTGGEIVNEFLLSTGYLAGAHDDNCLVGQHIRTLAPAWLRAEPGARHVGAL